VVAAGAAVSAACGGGGGGSSGGGGGGRSKVSLTIESKNMHEYFKVRVPHLRFGDNLAQLKVMRLALSQCLASKQSSICAADRFICSHINKIRLLNRNRILGKWWDPSTDEKLHELFLRPKIAHAHRSNCLPLFSVIVPL
jgi:hypothetical protein